MSCLFWGRWGGVKAGKLWVKSNYRALVGGRSSALTYTAIWRQRHRQRLRSLGRVQHILPLTTLSDEQVHVSLWCFAKEMVSRWITSLFIVCWLGSLERCLFFRSRQCGFSCHVLELQLSGGGARIDEREEKAWFCGLEVWRVLFGHRGTDFWRHGGPLFVLEVELWPFFIIGSWQLAFFFLVLFVQLWCDAFAQL